MITRSAKSCRGLVGMPIGVPCAVQLGLVGAPILFSSDLRTAAARVYAIFGLQVIPLLVFLTVIGCLFIFKTVHELHS
jgi:hypothetical protein